MYSGIVTAQLPRVARGSTGTLTVFPKRSSQGLLGAVPSFGSLAVPGLLVSTIPAFVAAFAASKYKSPGVGAAVGVGAGLTSFVLVTSLIYAFRPAA